MVLGDYGMGFVINTGIWLASIDCLNTWITDEICNRKCSIRRPRSGTYLYAIIEQVRNVKDGIPHRHKNYCEIDAYKPKP